MNQNPKEKRRFRRVPLDVDLFYEVSGAADVRMKKEGLEHTTHLVNIGEGGIAFESPFELPASTELNITFNLSPEKAQGPKISTIGQVRYCVLRGDFKTYQVGVEFTQIKESDKKLIVDYVNQKKS